MIATESEARLEFQAKRVVGYRLRACDFLECAVSAGASTPPEAPILFPALAVETTYPQRAQSFQLVVSYHLRSRYCSSDRHDATGFGVGGGGLSFLS